MKIIRTLKITSDEFFDYLDEQLMRDLAASGEGGAGEQAIVPGLSFTLHADDKYRRADVEVLVYERGRRYATRIVTMGDDVSMSYEVAPATRGDGIEVTYVQEMASHASRRRGFLRGFSEAVYLGHMADALYTIQNKMLDRREGKAGGPASSTASVERPDQKLIKKLVERTAR